MKEISNEVCEDISDVILFKSLAISESSLEKDFHVTDVLCALASIKNDHFDLVFCGGTCLSKAHGLIERFSEDVDIKVVSKVTDVPASKSSTRRNLSILKDDIKAALIEAGFAESDIKIKGENGNAMIGVELAYSAKFHHSSQLREFVKLELVHTDLLRPFSSKAIPRLFDTLSGTNDPQFKINCIDPRETLVEKLVSFPRRFGMHLDGVGREFDPTLVRHLYDVHQITNHATAIVQDRADLADLFSKIVDIDSAQFKNQNQKFSENPILVMREALTIASGSDEMRQNYDAFMNDLVYAPDEKRPSFKEAINNFQDLFESLVQECQKDKSLDSTITKIDSPDLVSGKTIAEHLKDPAQSKRHKIDDDPQPT